MPVLVGALVAALAVASLGLPLHAEVSAPAHRRGAGAGFLAFAGFAFLYGAVETLNGNWAILYVTHALRGGAALASLALTAFWATVTGGRVLFAAIERWLPARHTFRILPWVEAAGFVGVALLPSSPGMLGPLAFALTGLGCSALLPLTISLGRRALSAGQVITFYQMGYGLSAFGVGPLEGHVGLRPVFGGGAAMALALGVLALAIVHRPSGVTSALSTSTALPVFPRTRRT
jgi:hypothetical protein